MLAQLSKQCFLEANSTGIRLALAMELGVISRQGQNSTVHKQRSVIYTDLKAWVLTAENALLESCCLKVQLLGMLSTTPDWIGLSVLCVRLPQEWTVRQPEPYR